MDVISHLSAHANPKVPLAPLTWFGLGGAAEWFAEPKSAEELAELVRVCRDVGMALRTLGQGANLLVSDDGVDGLVVRLKAPLFRRIDWPDGEPGGDDEVLVNAGGGADMGRLVSESMRRGLAGMECMGGIPGSLGGIIRMNAGGRFGSISEVVREIRIIDADGRSCTLTHKQIGFSYRHTELDGATVVGATLGVRRDDPRKLRDRCLEIMEYKKKSQPMAEYSAGCVFKNPPGRSAGQLIDQAGLKGRWVGGARVSTQHANFIVAKEGASAKDVLTLIGIIRREVAQRSGVELELEVQLWGHRHARTAELTA